LPSAERLSASLNIRLVKEIEDNPEEALEDTPEDQTNPENGVGFDARSMRNTIGQLHRAPAA
jgi:hypothetical protein